MLLRQALLVTQVQHCALSSRHLECVECVDAESSFVHLLSGLLVPLLLTFLPNNLQARFGRLPGVTTTERHGAVPVGADS